MESIDVLVASVVVLSFSALALHWFVVSRVSYDMIAHSQSCFLNALRASDFLIYDAGGLAVRSGSLVLDHVVDCSRVARAYAYLSSRFSLFVSCGPYSAGPEKNYDAQVIRYAYWDGHGVVPVVVKTCPR